MRLTSAIRELVQLCFDFVAAPGDAAEPAAPAQPEPSAGLLTGDFDRMQPITADAEATPVPPRMPQEPGDEEQEMVTPGGMAGRDEGLEQECQRLLLRLGILDGTKLVTVHWNPRLRSTAGYASYPSWRIELNPRLREFEGQVSRTLRHELAHLVAYHRAGRRRIEPHGGQWRQACADLGIPGEPAHHRLPFPRSRMQRHHAYQCPACNIVISRVRPFKRATACLACCRKHSRGGFDPRFKFVKVPMGEDGQPPPPGDAGQR